MNKNGGSVEKEIKLKKKDGSVIHVLLNSRSINFLDQQLFVDNLIDITPHKRVLDRLSENDKYLDTVFNSINSGVYIIDPDTKEILEINNYALDLLKYNKRDLIGRKCFEKICTANMDNCLSKNLSGCAADNERSLIDSEGKEIEVLKSVKEINIEGKNYLLETFTDITILKENEEKVLEREEILQATLEATDDGILVLDEKYNIINSNQTYFDMWRIGQDDFVNLSALEAVKKNFVELKNPLESFRNIQRVIGTDDKLLDVLFFKDGRVYERYSAPIFKKKVRAGRVWRFKDITPQALAESKLRELNDELEDKINESTIELRISESRLKEAQEIAHLGHWVFDLSTRQISGSENTYQLLKLKNKNEEIALNDFLKTVYYKDRYELKRRFVSALRKKKVFDYVHRVTINGSTLLYLRQKCKTFYDNKGKPIYSLGIVQDITEQKMAEAAIAERERQLNMAMEGTGLGLWDWNMVDNTIKINKRFIEVIGYDGIISKSEIGFDFLVSIIHIDDYARIMNCFLNYIQSDSKTFEEEFRLKHSKGYYVWVHVRAKVFEWQNNKPSRSIGTFLDITERRLAEIKVQKSEEKFRTLTELSPSAICIQSIDKLLFVNPAWVEALGYSEKQALKHSFVELVHPEYRELAERYSRLRLFEGTNAPGRYEIKMLTRKKEIKWFDISVTVINFEGQKASLAVLNDITKIKLTEQALRDSEQKFKSLFYGNHSVMFLIDADSGRFIEANQKACEFYQFTQKEITGMSVWDISLLKPDEIKKSLKLAIDGKQSQFTARHRLANGEIRDVEAFSGKVKYEGKDILYSIIHDVTDRILAEEKIRKSQKELQLLNDQKDKFFSIISHDLKGPIGNFMQFAELLKNHKELLTSESAEALIDHSYNLANNTYKLLENLLVWSRSQLGGIKINQQMIPLYPLINETIKLLEDGAQNKNITLVNNVEKSTLIFADRDTILTVIRNLFSNAIKFTHKGGSISCEATKCKKNVEEDGFLSVSIVDTGVGISEDKIANLFTFGREFTTFGTNNEKGSGLGLILCKDLVELNGGKITVTSKKDVGSTFTFSVRCTPKY
ncbi:MAG: PAS domain S-box protein [Chloroflexia bacterium]|nr:PAS domain S-box protein [Chloroflexia bacterium]